MEQQLKQRLVGVAVIFSLAIIFLPMLLDGSGNHPSHLKVSIPEKPPVPSYELVNEKVEKLKNRVERIPQPAAQIVDEISDPLDIPEPAQKQAITTAPEAQKPQQGKAKVEPAVIPAKESSQVKIEAEPEPLKSTEKKPEEIPSGGSSWVIQVGSFSDKNKAYKQRDKLRKSGLAAVFIEKFKHNGGLSYRVRMGPFVSRDNARIIGNKLRAKYNIKGLVMHYEK